ncbi:hypothetical protein [Colwellia piezophila]|uniref:hypothetical protein n=1 Tax=Colwellia piezophila TaxID=211668 RepID=UPI00037EBD37|nr:hypothetical protein [Colwellia piezophila]
MLGKSFSLAIGAGESCHTCADIPYLGQRHDLINIKLDKSGGLIEGVKMAEMAKIMAYKSIKAMLVVYLPSFGDIFNAP